MKHHLSVYESLFAQLSGISSRRSLVRASVMVPGRANRFWLTCTYTYHFGTKFDRERWNRPNWCIHSWHLIFFSFFIWFPLIRIPNEIKYQFVYFIRLSKRENTALLLKTSNGYMQEKDKTYCHLLLLLLFIYHLTCFFLIFCFTSKLLLKYSFIIHLFYTLFHIFHRAGHWKPRRTFHLLVTRPF